MLKLFQSKIKKSNDLAERIFEYRPYKPHLSKCPDLKVRFICKDCESMQDALNKVIEYCEGADTSQERYLYAITYAWSRVIYNERAIYYLEKYLNNELYNKYTKSEKLKITHLKEMYSYLIDCYTKDLKYDKALVICDYFINNISNNELTIFYKKADILRRKNNLQEAINVFQEAKNHICDKYDLQCINNHIEDLKEKIKKEYVFKPKLNKRERLKLYSDEIYEIDIRN